MRITIQLEKLSQFVSKVEKVAGKNPSLPILSCILFEVVDKTLTMRATNLDLGVEAKVQVSDAEDGRIAVPASILSSYLGQLSGEREVTLRDKSGNLSIESSKGKSLIKALESDDFPTLPSVEAGVEVVLEAKDVVDGLRSVWYSAAISSMKPELASVYVYAEGHYLTFVATDSFRLAEKRVSLAHPVEFPGLLIPQRNVGEIVRILDSVDGEIRVMFDKNQVAFKSRSLDLVSRVIDATFPDYRQIMPKESVTDVVLLKQDFVQALRLSTLFSDSFNQVHFSIPANGESVTLSCKSSERGENEYAVPATVSGNELEINFNHRYLMDCMSSLKSDSISLKFSGPHKPLVIRGVSDSSFTYLAMSMNR